MISIGTAVSTMIGPTAYAVAAASAANVSPTDTAGAALAIPMTVSCAGPIALGSSPAGGASAVPATAVAGRSVIFSPVMWSRPPQHRGAHREKQCPATLAY